MTDNRSGADDTPSAPRWSYKKWVLWLGGTCLGTVVISIVLSQTYGATGDSLQDGLRVYGLVAVLLGLIGTGCRLVAHYGDPQKHSKERKIVFSTTDLDGLGKAFGFLGALYGVIAVFAVVS